MAEVKDGLRKIGKKIKVFPISIMGFVKKEFMLVWRRKKYLYLSLLLPLIIGLIYIFSLSGSENTMSAIVCDYDGSYTKNIVDSLEGFDVIVRRDKECNDEIIQLIQDREHLFGIIVPNDFSQSVENLQPGRIKVYYDNSDPSIAKLADWKIDVALEPFKNQMIVEFGKELQQKSSNAKSKTEVAVEILDYSQYSDNRIEKSIREADNDLSRLSGIDPHYMANPILTEQKGVHQEYSMLDIGIIPLFVVLCMFITTMLGSTGVLYDRKIQMFERIRASNSSMIAYFISKLIFFFFLTVIQFVLLLVLFYIFGAAYSIEFLFVLKAIIFVALVDVMIAFIIGLISDSEGVAVLFSLIVTLPLMFMSGMFYPLELMPKTLQWIAKVMPIHVETEMMKQSLLFGGDIGYGVLWMPVVLLIVIIWLVRKK